MEARTRGRRSYGGIAFGAAFLAVPLAAMLWSGGAKSLPPPAAAHYTAAPIVENCMAICTSVPERGADSLEIDGVPVLSVRVPTNYDRHHRHPLLVVYPPAGMDRFQSEAFYGLTTTATARGFLVAYSNARPLAKTTIAAQAKVADAVAQQWCVDRRRVAFVGHSDGANTAYGIALLEREAVQPNAMILSGAGIDRTALAAYACPATRSVLINHGRNDSYFPGYGRQAASWWSACFQCEADRYRHVAPDCAEALGCRPGARLVFCEPDVQHAAAPRVGGFELDFIEQALNDDGGW